MTFLKSFQTSTVKKNFTWQCDLCYTRTEQNKVATLSEQISDLKSSVETMVRQQNIGQIKKSITEEFNLIQEAMLSEIKSRFEEVQSKLAVELQNLKSEVIIPANDSTTPALGTPWDNAQRVRGIKASLLVKPSAGQAIDMKKVQAAAVDNGIPLDSVVVSSSGETFLNLPNEASRDKLQPILATIEPEKEIVVLKSKLPSVALLSVTEEHKSVDIIRMIKQQNEAVGNLMESGSHLSVVYTKKPREGQKFHQVVLRVSPEIRRAIRANNNRIHMSSSVHKVVDRFHVKRCNTCQSFGHYTEKCSNTKVCGYCSETTHLSKDCPIKDNGHEHHKCNNCIKQNLTPNTGHSAFWGKCPAYLDQQKRLKRTVGYNYEDSN